MAELISIHPILSAVPVATDTQNPRFARLAQIVLSDAVTFVRDDAYCEGASWETRLNEVLEAEHNRPFDNKKGLPFWRICVLECSETPLNFTLVLIFHHSLMDTQSALSLHAEIESRMTRATNTDRVYNILESPSTPLLPPIEILHSLPVSQTFLQSQQRPFEPSINSWTGGPQSLPVRSRFSLLFFSARETSNLVDRAKREQTTLTAAVQTMVAASVFSALPQNYFTLQADCAISLRRFLPEPITDTSLGCYVGSLSMMYTRAPSLDWGEARRTRKIIEDTLAKEGSDMPVGYLRHVPSLHDWMWEKIGSARMSAFELSNVGKIAPAREQTAFGIEAMAFSQSSSACSAAIKVSAVTGRDGRLALGFTWQEGIVKPSMIESIKRALKEHGRAYLDGPCDS